MIVWRPGSTTSGSARHLHGFGDAAHAQRDLQRHAACRPPTSMLSLR